MKNDSVRIHTLSKPLVRIRVLESIAGDKWTKASGMLTAIWHILFTIWEVKTSTARIVYLTGRTIVSMRWIRKRSGNSCEANFDTVCQQSE